MPNKLKIVDITPTNEVGRTEASASIDSVVSSNLLDITPIHGVVGGMRETTPTQPGKPIEYSWMFKLSHWVGNLYEAIVQGVKSRQPYTEPWKKNMKRVAAFFESLVNLLSSWRKA